jgi:AraC-like DNA-binding protein
MFAWLVGLCIVQSILVGLVWNYGLIQLRPVMPVTASLLPWLAWASFRTLVRPAAQFSPTTIGLLAMPTLAVVLALVTYPDAIDGLLIAIFFSFGLALWRMADAGPDALQGTQLHHSMRTHLAMRGAAASLLLNGVVDTAIVADYQFAGGQHVPGILSVFSVLNLIVIGLLALLASEGNAAQAEDATQPVAASQDEAETARRVEALLRETRLYADPDLTLTRIARKAGIPARAISTAINRYHGMNVSQYVNRFRLDEACRLLAETDLSVTEVHLEAGFQTKSNFNREFRRQYEVSPTEWRSTHHQVDRKKEPPAALRRGGSQGGGI